jgi:hypothetical protein
VVTRHRFADHQLGSLAIPRAPREAPNKCGGYCRNSSGEVLKRLRELVRWMTFGRIVIGTDYSGCNDFLTDKTGFPVPYQMRPLEPYEYPWSAGQLWAEPILMQQWRP